MGRSFLPALLLVGTIGARPLGPPPGDPPPRVARLSYVAGSVSFEPSGDTTWGQATLNYPVTIGDRVYADQGARAELQVGNVTFRLAGSTDVTMTNLTDGLVQLGVADGTLRASVYDLADGDSIEIDTPNGFLAVLAAGAYRVEVSADDSTTLVSVDSGQIAVSSGGPAQTLGPGEALRLTGANPAGIETAAMPPRESFDQWSAERDQRHLRAPGRQYLSGDLPGAADLDAAGHWEDSPEGPVWYPIVPAGWVPYRFGHWVWVEPWGWTWVEDEWWGFAPFHYGRWARFGEAWGWLPGPVVRRPCYAPALVVFVDGSRFSRARGVQVQAWFPLGPREPYNPWYHHSDDYLRQVNATNMRDGPDVTRFRDRVGQVHYANEHETTAVGADAFRHGQDITPHLVRPRPADLETPRIVPHPSVGPHSDAAFGGRPRQTAPVMVPEPRPRPQMRPVPPELPPQREAPPPARPELRPVPGPQPQHQPPPPTSGSGFRRPLVTQRPAPQPNPPFHAREEAMQAHPGRPLEPQQMDNVRAGRPPGPMHDAETPPHPAPASRAPAPRQNQKR